jgi:hypothetical protein
MYFFIGILLTLSSVIYARDFVKVAAQGTTKVLLDNDQVRVTGEALFMPAVTHMAKNVGTTTAKLVLTELKTSSKNKKVHV